ncbi:S-4TM family putative pore-forming effector [Chryseobacterium limigenitum]|uniref:Uncharacterized protein n=1 Tax=Chryseobacterium limigenitum TaxID=1612149 RepID=A0A1K2ITV1_9FLAO|nr:S-4TM family putative pore-forming effector [Chryseobacterium limigenitum]SFZ95163.1 hypothetical protein SAMN05216324_108179 [Chryseobacterium limigenitum]
MENTILTRQNEQANIDRLCAQKQIYINAKKLFMFQIIITVPVTVILALLKLILMLTFKIDISSYVVVYGIAIALSDLALITPLIGDTKKNGAKVQELFDCSVFALGWNSLFVGKKPPQEIINKNSRKFLKSKPDMAKIYNWYPVELVKHEDNKAILLCQKTNLNYDSSLRNSYLKRVVMVGLGTLLILVLFGLLEDYSVKNFFIQLGASFLPVFVLALKIFIEQNKTIKSSEELDGSITSLLEQENALTQIQVRNIQDRIYINRKDGGLVPEFFYQLKRKSLEEDMHDNASRF